MFSGIRKGIEAMFGSFGAIFKYRLWGHVLASGFLGLAVAAFLFRTVWRQSDRLGDYLSSFYGWEKGANLVGSITDWLVWAIMLIITALLYKHIMLILSAPIMSKMSEKIEAIKHNTTLPSLSFQDSIKSMARGFALALRNIWREILFTVILLLIGLIPVVGVVSAIAIFLVQAYYAGFGNLDFYLERHLGRRDSISFVRRNRWTAITIGSAFLGLLLIPVVGWFLAPILCATGASLAADDLLD